MKKTFTIVAMPFLVIGVLLLVISFFLPSIAFVILLVVSLLVLLVGVGLLVAAAFAKDKPSQKLLSSGHAVEATVLEVHHPPNVGASGASANPVVRFVLGVNGPMGPTQVTIEQATPQMYVQKVHEGSVVPVRIDPANPNVALIDWAHASAVLDGTVPPMDRNY